MQRSARAATPNPDPMRRDWGPGRRRGVVPTDLPRDVSISAVEYRPGNRRVVHHMMAFVDTHGYGRERDAAEPGPGYTSYSGAGVDIHGELGGWAAGNEATHLPDGIGRS